MDTIKSFKGYGKVDETEQHAFQKKVRKRVAIIIVSAIVLVAILIAVVAGISIHRRNYGADAGARASKLSPAQSLKAVCAVTEYPDSCFSSISAHSLSSNVTDPKRIFSLSLQVAIDSLSKIISVPRLYASRVSKNITKAALDDCAALFDDAIDHLNDSISSIAANGGGGSEKLLSSAMTSDVKTWLSAALTDQETCLDGLSEIDGAADLAGEIRSSMRNSTEYVSNSLAIVTRLFSILGKLKIPKINRKLLGVDENRHEGLPEWLGAAEKRMLQEKKVVPNVVVSADGSGDYKTIGEAVKAAPIKSTGRYVIYVKAGTYKENVVVAKNVWDVMMYGDGMGKTIVSGALNFIDGTPTFSTATVAVAGRGFIAKDMAFKNEAGAEKHQAVAFRSGSDRSIFYRCLFDGYQDTLYAHSHRQFYRDCTITGTIDFIFGNAAVVLQNCNILPRQPMTNQFNTITAQGKKDKNQNTGMTIQKCTISASGQLIAPTYLGRPWKEFSTTVIMQSNIGSFLHPSGWKEWVSGVDPASTIFYAEYENTGPGADVSQRVKWAGYKPTLTADEASRYTVQNFIDGGSWLREANVAYDESL